MYIDFSIIRRDFFDCELYKDSEAKFLYLHLLKISSEQGQDFLISKNELSETINISVKRLQTLLIKFQEYKIIEIHHLRKFFKIKLIFGGNYVH